MSITLTSVETINNLKASAEATTGESYADLTEAVQALKDGYGSGGNGEFVGIKYSGFDEETGFPTVADARSLGGRGLPSTSAMDYVFYGTGNNLDSKLKEVYLPNEITKLSATFINCASLEKVYGLETITHMTNAFSGCTALADFPYLPNLLYLGTNNFKNCTSLESIRLGDKIITIALNVFSGCTNLTDIYVPWAEGEVANAPWGAPNENLTIHYNTTYDENHNPVVSE